MRHTIFASILLTLGACNPCDIEVVSDTAIIVSEVCAPGSSSGSTAMENESSGYNTGTDQTTVGESGGGECESYPPCIDGKCEGTSVCLDGYASISDKANFCAPSCGGDEDCSNACGAAKCNPDGLCVLKCSGDESCSEGMKCDGAQAVCAWPN